MTFIIKSYNYYNLKNWDVNNWTIALGRVLTCTSLFKIIVIFQCNSGCGQICSERDSVKSTNNLNLIWMEIILYHTYSYDMIKSSCGISVRFNGNVCMLQVMPLRVMVRSALSARGHQGSRESRVGISWKITAMDVQTLRSGFESLLYTRFYDFITALICSWQNRALAPGWKNRCIWCMLKEQKGCWRLEWRGSSQHLS